MPNSWIIEAQAEQGKEPEECFMEGSCAHASLGIFLSVSLPLPRTLRVLSPVPRPFWNDAHSFTMPHLCHSFLIYSLCCLSLPRPSLPPLSPHSLDDFKWPQGKLFGVQVEFRRRPGSLSLFSPSSRHVKVSPGFLLTQDQPRSSKPPEWQSWFSPLCLGLCVWSSELLPLRLTLGSLVSDGVFFAFLAWVD